ncbi:hypothetical protein M514_02460 [Trichuris suis]|uniref:Uncharacterized protein n=1 Tax=Trichuris suis TaxID=68888 RepID=A0A085NF79_9BILA|nr:hypothetical protein M513_02460 [Trichuris suis]KFD68125.1 hypothetical protein M514_02460 [Trichuris suis]
MGTKTRMGEVLCGQRFSGYSLNLPAANGEQVVNYKEKVKIQRIDYARLLWPQITDAPDVLSNFCRKGVLDLRWLGFTMDSTLRWFRRQRTLASSCARFAFAQPSDTRCDCLSMQRSCCELQASQSCDHQRGRTCPLPVIGGKRGL